MKFTRQKRQAKTKHQTQPNRITAKRRAKALVKSHPAKQAHTIHTSRMKARKPTTPWPRFLSRRLGAGGQLLLQPADLSFFDPGVGFARLDHLAQEMNLRLHLTDASLLLRQLGSQLRM
eukprot:scaffold4319_cov101-Isochrysis_galbana.AAC.1